ncbi:hypothetical protein AB0K12_42415 [Nonomuraea sp. NPDC049419]|uniref:hypothetical protein n=1 Tax=Nonomuraea sp. NPDC049419 TaxID=3155772 RepID=UPI00343D277B
MTTSYKVKFWDIRTNTRADKPGKKPRVVSHTVRWTVGNREKSQTFKTKGLAEGFLSDLRQAAKKGEAFDVDSGLPASMVKAKDGPDLVRLRRHVRSHLVASSGGQVPGRHDRHSRHRHPRSGRRRTRPTV